MRAPRVRYGHRALLHFDRSVATDEVAIEYGGIALLKVTQLLGEHGVERVSCGCGFTNRLKNTNRYRQKKLNTLPLDRKNICRATAQDLQFFRCCNDVISGASRCRVFWLIRRGER